jgi:hypothetical protein
MAARCRFTGHKHQDRGIWNNGHYFAACERCGTDLIRKPESNRWKPVPKGYRIEWRERRDCDIRW